MLTLKSTLIERTLVTFCLLSLAGLSLPAQQARRVDAPPTEKVTALPGFKVERIYTVTKEQGSWVAMTLDDKGRLITSDQYGGLYRMTLPVASESKVTAVEKLDSLGIGGAHGLLYAHHSLYVMVNENRVNKFGEGKSGLHRLRDTNGDDKFDQAELLREMTGSGEHGPHGLVLGPDGKTIYYMNGNNTSVPVNLEKHIPVAWQEDHIVPRMWPPVGNGRGIMAPAGYTARTDPDGREHELIAMGLRNAYRFVFDPNGEIFTYDSDTENENGTPWYLPTRVNHVVSGGDYGWRSGSGRWPAYYADSLPAVLEVGPGSPTGMVMGTGTRFPAKYQRALFAADWTFGTLYALHMIPAGATFRAIKEEFVSGQPLPITDVLVNSSDGALYFTAGGRITDSALYRVTYVGAENTAPAPYPAPTAEARLRRELEALHTTGAGESVVDRAWPHLSNPDRFIRWAARVAIERQPPALWSRRALTESDPQASLEALLALVRLGDKSLQTELINRLSLFDIAQLPAEQKFQAVRLWELIFTRMGEPAPAVKQRVAAQLDRLYPHPDKLLSRELAGLLVYLDSPTVVAKTVPLLKLAEQPEPQDIVDEALLARNDRYGPTISGLNKTRPARQQFAYATALRSARVGWNSQLREEYFSWFNQAYHWTGGLSFGGFINNIRMIALAGVPDAAERDRLAKLSLRPDTQIMANAVAPKGPGKSYTLEDATKAVRGQLGQRDFNQGRTMFTSAACATCHRLGNLGMGTAGPILTQAGSRYTEHDLLQAIIEPSAGINENYAATRYEMKDGTVMIGYPTFEEGAELFIVTNLMVPNVLTLVKKTDLISSRPSEISLMPPGLINSLNENELRDLVAYILAGGDRTNPMFAPLRN